jgi:hypothetical protein
MEDSNDFPLPPANFAFLVESVLMQTQMQLGLLKFGEEEDGNQEPNLPLARHSIDMLAVLQEKTRGNLTVEEQRLLENGLTELRFRYVQVAEQQKQKPVPTAGSSVDDKPRIIMPDDDARRIITPGGGKGTKST